MIPAQEAVARAHREEWARVVAALARRFSDLDIAEEAAAEAFATAVERWHVDGVPANPGGWLTTTATRRAIDRLRREARRDAKHEEAAMLASPREPVGPVEDEVLRLMFVCCHPALAPEARVALTLRMVGGLTAAEIARAFLVPEPTMGQRLTRAKRKIREARIPFRLPEREDVAERLDGVLTVVYLVFNEGYLAGSGEEAIRVELTDEAIRLARLLRTLMPDDGEVAGLLALMLMTEARRASRVSAEGELVTLDEQDRGGWDHSLIAEGQALVRACIASGRPPGRYQLQAAINAVHTSAPDFRATDWGQVLQLYEMLAVLDPGPVVALNRAVALAEIDGPAVALAEVDRLPLEGYHAWHATRADLLRRLGRSEASRAAYTRAIELAGNPAERRYLTRRRGELVAPEPLSPVRGRLAPMTTPEPLTLPADDQAEAWVRERAESALARARELADRLRTVRPASAVETLQVWDEVTLALHGTAGLASLLANVHPVEAVRTTAEAAEVAVDKLRTELSQDAELYAAFAELPDDQVAALDPLAARFLDKVLTDFRRAGVDRDEATRLRLVQINERLTELQLELARVTRDDVRSIKVTPDRLAGLPADWLEAHPVGDDGLVTVTTDYPDYMPTRMFAHDAEVRRELAQVYLDRGYPHNDVALREIFDLRHELATLVGFPDWPSYDADVKMIGSGPAIPEFIDKIAAAAEEPMQRDLAVLLERYRRDVPDAKAITVADSSYYEELVRRERFDVDSQQVRTYFDFAKVRAGLLEVTGRLFGLRYDEVDVPVWHEDVTVYDVYREDTGAVPEELARDERASRRVGRIYLDLHPRPGKYKHAAQFDLAPGLRGRNLAEGVLVCNFSRGLMEHSHVVTLFHEFGHLVHHVLGGQGKWTRFSGVATEWDFVEAPSQMLEEWAWDPQVLASFATDADGEPIPAELVARMRAGEDFGRGVRARVQMFYAAVSYWFHQERPSDLTARLRALQDRYSPFPYIPDTHFHAAFGHLGGYSSAYYTYMWSLVIAKDLFSAFDRDNLFDPEVAGRYRDTILARGGEKDAADLVADFLGRPFTFDAYAAWVAG